MLSVTIALPELYQSVVITLGVEEPSSHFCSHMQFIDNQPNIVLCDSV